VRDRANSVLDGMRDPYAVSAHFARSIADLRAGLDKVKLPERAAREFFEELADAEICVCGRPIDDHIKEAIKAGAKQYLGSDDVSLLNMMKTSIHEAVGDDPAEPERALRLKVASLEEIVSEERDASNSLDALRLEAEQSDPAVKQAKEDIESLLNELLAVNKDLEKFDNKDDRQGDTLTFGIDILERRLKDAEKKLAEITKTIELKDKRDILLAILQKAHETSKKAIATEICRETNSRISKLMPDNDLLVDRIDRSIVLAGQGGGSVGETLSIAYAFLSTLFDRSDHKLPFVVDSPAGPIDLAIRPMVGELIPACRTSSWRSPSRPSASASSAASRRPARRSFSSSPCSARDRRICRRPLARSATTRRPPTDFSCAAASSSTISRSKRNDARCSRFASGRKR
jgi:hypothetical protein